MALHFPKAQKPHNACIIKGQIHLDTLNPSLPGIADDYRFYQYKAQGDLILLRYP